MELSFYNPRLINWECIVFGTGFKYSLILSTGYLSRASTHFMGTSGYLKGRFEADFQFTKHDNSGRISAQLNLAYPLAIQ